MKNKKGQAWGMDLIVSVFIFLSAIVLFYNYSTNLNQDSENLDVLIKEGTTATNIILSEGYPTNWDKLNVEKPGVMIGNEINRDKLQLFLELTSENYTRVKNMLGTKFDFYILFSTNRTIFVNSTVEGIGMQGVTSSEIENINSKRLVKISRLVILDKKPIKLNFYLWD